MYGVPIEAELAEIDRDDAGKPRKKVTVLGGGMAGLVAAYELSRLGHSVTVIEAQNRVGGRVWTWRPEKHPGQYHELGAMRIPQAHDYTRYYIRKCSLPLRRFVNHHDDPDSFYYIRGIATTHRDAIVKLIQDSTFRRLSYRERQIIEEADTPLALMGPLGAIATAIRHDPASRDALFGKGPPTPLIEKLERQSLLDFLKEHLDTNEAIELVGAVTGLEVWWDKAVTMLLRDEVAQHGGGELEEIEGGMDRLPNGLYEFLRNRTNVEFKLEAAVRSIAVGDEQVQITYAPPNGRGETVRVDCDYVICTIPFGVMRRLEIAGVTPDKLRAIRNLTYASSTKVLLLCKKRFWERSYNIFGGGSQTDLINRQVYYPSDSFKPAGTTDSSELSSTAFQFLRVDKSKQQQPSHGPGVLVGCYNWGADARRLGALSHDDRVQVVRNCLAHIHPEILEDGMVEDCTSMFWDEFDWSGGAFCFLRPRDVDLYYADTIRPENNLFFAGEHCSLDQGWIQGAVSASLRAVKELVRRS